MQRITLRSFLRSLVSSQCGAIQFTLVFQNHAMTLAQTRLLNVVNVNKPTTLTRDRVKDQDTKDKDKT